MILQVYARHKFPGKVPFAEIASNPLTIQRLPSHVVILESDCSIRKYFGSRIRNVLRYCADKPHIDVVCLAFENNDRASDNKTEWVNITENLEKRKISRAGYVLNVASAKKLCDSWGELDSFDTLIKKGVKSRYLMARRAFLPIVKSSSS